MVEADAAWDHFAQLSAGPRVCSLATSTQRRCKPRYPAATPHCVLAARLDFFFGCQGRTQTEVAAKFDHDVTLHPYALAEDQETRDTMEVSSILFVGLSNLINVHPAGVATRYNIDEEIRADHMPYPDAMPTRSTHLVVINTQNRISWTTEQIEHVLSGVIPKNAIVRILFLSGIPDSQMRAFLHKNLCEFKRASVIQLAGQRAVNAVNDAGIFDESIEDIKPGTVALKPISGEPRVLVGNIHPYLAEAMGWLTKECEMLMRAFAYITAVAGLLHAVDGDHESPILPYIDRLRVVIATFRLPMQRVVVRYRAVRAPSSSVFHPRSFNLISGGKSHTRLLTFKVFGLQFHLTLSDHTLPRYIFRYAAIDSRSRYSVRVNVAYLWFEIVSQTTNEPVAAIPFWRALKKVGFCPLVHVAEALELLSKKDMIKSCSIWRFNPYDFQQWHGESDATIRRLFARVQVAIEPLKYILPSKAIETLPHPFDWHRSPFFTGIDKNGQLEPLYVPVVAGIVRFNLFVSDNSPVILAWTLGAEAYAVDDDEDDDKDDDDESHAEAESEVCLDFHDYGGEFGFCLVLREKPTAPREKGKIAARLPLGVAWELAAFRFLLLIAVGHRLISFSDIENSPLTIMSHQRYARLRTHSIAQRIERLENRKKSEGA
uniref:Uncharacterized protein n=1 Tax=Mycena chlorophos TaxID=658473 RepID=A0ABQ0LCM2_MYCCL|nr:predicted protein [Mycena chlorophos]